MGVVCIPENVKVDKKTGSQYLLNDEGAPIMNPDTAKHLEFYKSNEDLFIETLKSLEKIAEKYGYGYEKRQRFFASPEVQQATNTLRFSDVRTFQSYLDFVGTPFQPVLEEFYQFRNRSYYQRPPVENLVTSQEFWSNYFEKHPERRPSKIMYFSWRFQGEKNQDIIRSGAYNSLFEAKKFSGTQDLPNYPQFLEATKQEMRSVVDKTYDGVVS